MREVWLDGSAESVARLHEALAEALDGGQALVPLSTHDAQLRQLREVAAPQQPLEADTAVVIPTSGSTGTAKGVLLSARALTASATATHRRLGGAGSWLLATPPQYIGGLQVLVRAMAAGTEPAVVDMAAGFGPETFAAGAARLRGSPRYTALVPTQLARLLDAGGQGLAAAAEFDAIVLGGAPLHDELRMRAAAAGINVVPAYGMSETASGCVYDGTPLDGVQLRLGPDDRIEIAGPVLAHGYRLRPDLTTSSFTAGWLRTSDRGAWHDDGTLRVLGRIDDVVNTGAIKVSAAEVERVLLAQPGVSGAAVVGLPDREWGEVVAAAVTATSAPDPNGLRTAVRAELGGSAVPRVLRHVAELPRRGPGKIDKTTLRTQLSPQ